MKRTVALATTIAVALAVIGVASPSLATRPALRQFPLLGRFAPETAESCRSLDPAYLELQTVVSNGGDQSPGRVVSLSDGTLAVLLVITGVDKTGNVTAVDFAASLRISALVITSGDTADKRSFDPPIRNASDLQPDNGGTIDAIAFCYRVNIPKPPTPNTGSPTSEAPASETAVSPTVTPTKTPTSLSLDLSGQQTAEAANAALQATATAAAADASAAAATQEAQLAEIAATATAQSAAAATAQASADAALAAAQATIDSLQSTVAAPTSTAPATDTPIPTATPTPIGTTIAYETSGDAPFAAWQRVSGWDVSGTIAKTDGSAGGDWLIVPAPSSLGANQIADVEFRVTGGDVCPRNFGVAVRGSDNGFYAGGIEWGCDAASILWISGDGAVKNPLPGPLDGEWHTLRVAVIGDLITVSLDGQEIQNQTDTRFADGKLIAIWSNGVGLEIRAVRVYEAQA